MKAQGRKILLLVDNCTAHPEMPNLDAVKVIFLPKNTTLVLQPMDMGIIQSLKAYYRNSLVKKIIQSYNAGSGLPKISVLDAMLMGTLAWDSVTTTTIINCFKKAGISHATQDAANCDADDLFASLGSSMTVLHEHNPSLIPDECNAEFSLTAIMILKHSGLKV